MQDKEKRLIKQAALVLRSLNHKLRVKIIETLRSKSPKPEGWTVTQLYVFLRMEQSVASQHLAILRRQNIVSTRRDGKFIYYAVNEKRIEEILENCKFLMAD